MFARFQPRTAPVETTDANTQAQVETPVKKADVHVEANTSAQAQLTADGKEDFSFKAKQAELFARFQPKSAPVETVDTTVTPESKTQVNTSTVEVKADDEPEITADQFAQAFRTNAASSTVNDPLQSLADLATAELGADNMGSAMPKAVIPTPPVNLMGAKNNKASTDTTTEEAKPKKSLASIVGNKDAQDKPMDLLEQIKAGKKLKHVEPTVEQAQTKPASDKVLTRQGSSLKDVFEKAISEKMHNGSIKSVTQQVDEESELDAYDMEEKIERQVQQNMDKIEDAAFKMMKTSEFKTALKTMVEKLELSLAPEIDAISKAYVAKMIKSSDVSADAQDKLAVLLKDIQDHSKQAIHEQLGKAYDAALKAMQENCTDKAAKELGAQLEAPMKDEQVQAFVEKLFAKDLTSEIGDVVLKGMKDMLANDTAFVNDGYVSNADVIEQFKAGYYADRRELDKAVNEVEPKEKDSVSTTGETALKPNYLFEEITKRGLAMNRDNIDGPDNEEEAWSDDEELFTPPSSAHSSASIAPEDFAKAFGAKVEDAQPKGGMLNNILDFGKGLFGYGTAAKQTATLETNESTSPVAKPDTQPLTLGDVLGQKPIEGLENSGPASLTSGSPQVAVDVGANPAVLTQNVLPPMIEQQHMDAL